MGKKYASEGYTCCKNPASRPNGKNGHLSWRLNSRIPEAPLCKFCKVPFVGDMGWWDQEGWMQKDSKGRNIRAPAPKESKADEVQRQVLELFKDDAEKLGVLKQVFPEKQAPAKTDGDQLREAVDAVEKAELGKARVEKTCQDMEASLHRKAQELFDYQERVEQHQQKLQDAKQALQVAKDHLDALRTRDVPPQQKSGPEDVQAIYAQINPEQGITESLACLPELQALGANAAIPVKDAVTTLFRRQFQQLCQHMAEHLAIPASAPRPSAYDAAVAFGFNRTEPMLYNDPSVFDESDFTTADAGMDRHIDGEPSAKKPTLAASSANPAVPTDATAAAAITFNALQLAANITGRMATNEAEGTSPG